MTANSKPITIQKKRKEKKKEASEPCLMNVYPYSMGVLV